MNRFTVVPITAMLTAWPIAAVNAATATGNLNVRIVIETTCTVVTPASLDFGTHGILATDIDVSTTISVTCTNLLPYKIRLGAGTGTGATVTTRKMTGTLSDTLNYQLFRNAGHTQNWGETDGTDTVDATGTGAAVLHQVYGRVPAQTTPQADTYTDQVTITVVY